MPLSSIMRMLLLIASLVAAVFIGSLFAHTQRSFTSSPLQASETTSTAILPTNTGEAPITICEPDDGPIACLPGALDSSQNLANPVNGVARPAVSNDAHSASQASVVNDGLSGASWVSNSADSWIKIDLGQVRTINTVTLEKEDLVSSPSEDFGGFVVAVTLSDLYADGDSSDDDKEYTQVFSSAQANFSSTVSHTVIEILFSPMKARFVKILFEKQGAAIEEVGIFMVDPSMLVEQPTITATQTLPGITLTSASAWLAISTRTSVIENPPTYTPPTTAAPSQTSINTPQPSNTPAPLPTNTQPQADTPTLVPTDTQPPVDTAIPAPTDALSTEVPPTAVEPTATP